MTDELKGRYIGNYYVSLDRCMKFHSNGSIEQEDRWCIYLYDDAEDELVFKASFAEDALNVDTLTEGQITTLLAFQ